MQLPTAVNFTSSNKRYFMQDIPHNGLDAAAFPLICLHSFQRFLGMDHNPQAAMTYLWTSSVHGTKRLSTTISSTCSLGRFQTHVTCTGRAILTCLGGTVQTMRPRGVFSGLHITTSLKLRVLLVSIPWSSVLSQLTLSCISCKSLGPASGIARDHSIHARGFC